MVGFYHVHTPIVVLEERSLKGAPVKYLVHLSREIDLASRFVLHVVKWPARRCKAGWVCQLARISRRDCWASLRSAPTYEGVRLNACINAAIGPDTAYSAAHTQSE